MRKALEELRKLNSRNLLLYFKAERGRFYQSYTKYSCSCCGEWLWHLYKDHEADKIKFKEHRAYLDLVKIELDTRGHVDIKTYIKDMKILFHKPHTQIKLLHGNRI